MTPRRRGPGRLSEPQAGVDRGGHDRIMTGRSLNRRVADLVLVSEDLDRLVREGPMSNFDIDVTRDGGWWMVHIPKLGGRTQARYPSEVKLTSIFRAAGFGPGEVGARQLAG